MRCLVGLGIKTGLRTLINGPQAPRVAAAKPEFTGHELGVTPPPVSDAAAATVRQIRSPGSQRGPSIMIHGLTARTGTNYIWFLLQLHPDVAGCTQSREFFFLQRSLDAIALQKRYDETDKAIKSPFQAPGDVLALLGASTLAYLHSFAPEDKRLLLKVPNVRFLHYFPTAFANENLLVLMRDGRDVVASYRESWPHIPFHVVCTDWAEAVRVAQDFQKTVGTTFPSQVGRYEDAVADPEGFVKTVCPALGLDLSIYPFEKIREVPVLGSCEVKSGEQWKWQVAEKKPKDFSPVGRWKKWSEEDKATFKRIAGEALVAAGYATDDAW